ncbi:hypothetical protein FRX31_020115 [Thalictrum thalictroides]|uniref:Uncharacterized protein n=1 Tax=Thalictrum thalictroides TaxID=46969 RepID=A0A7J6W0L3_THATH|nr:hypothetical protein FRX31_020115 [Thalictrum thalictroides]
MELASLTIASVFDREYCFNFLLVAYTHQKVVIPLKKGWAESEFRLGKYVDRLLKSRPTN